MTLINEYYKIDSRTETADGTVFGITLLPDCEVYNGHFPNNPVSPGVCNIQMIKECAEMLTGKRLFLGFISQCKFQAIITPKSTPKLNIIMAVTATDGCYKVRASVADLKTVYIEFNGEFSIKS